MTLAGRRRLPSRVRVTGAEHTDCDVTKMNMSDVIDIYPYQGVTCIQSGTYCEPKMTTVGSQDTTGPMTRDELKDLACLGFSADLNFNQVAEYQQVADTVKLAA